MIDDNGFKRPTDDELVEDLSNKWKERFGDNANTEANSVGGIFIRIVAFFLSKLYSLAEVTYNSQFLDSATGVTLDQLAGNQGYTRHAAQTAIGKVKIYGTAGYVVPEGTIFKTSDELEYVTSEAITLIDTGSNTAAVAGITDPISVGNDKNVGIGESEVLYANGEGSKYNKPLTYENYTVYQVTTVEEIQVVQVGEITGGADAETDDELRERLKKSYQESPSSPLNGVISAVRNVNGVKSVKVVVNDTMEIDSEGNPAKTIHIYVDGGETKDVANAIFESVAAGIQTYGNTKVQVTDIANVTHTVCFDQPTIVEIFASVKVETNDDFPLDGLDQIKQSVIDYINGVGMGETVYFSYLFKYIYDNIPGIEVATIGIGTDKAKLSMTDIELKSTERVNISSENIEVVGGSDE